MSIAARMARSWLNVCFLISAERNVTMEAILDTKPAIKPHSRRCIRPFFANWNAFSLIFSKIISFKETFSIIIQIQTLGI